MVWSIITWCHCQAYKLQVPVYEYHFTFPVHILTNLYRRWKQAFNEHHGYLKPRDCIDSSIAPSRCAGRKVSERHDHMHWLFIHRSAPAVQSWSWELALGRSIDLHASSVLTYPLKMSFQPLIRYADQHMKKANIPDSSELHGWKPRVGIELSPHRVVKSCYRHS